MGKTYTHSDQKAIELGHTKTKIKILLEYLFEINSKSRPVSGATIKTSSQIAAPVQAHSAKQGESGNCKMHRFKDKSRTLLLQQGGKERIHWHCGDSGKQTES